MEAADVCVLLDIVRAQGEPAGAKEQPPLCPLAVLGRLGEK